MRNIAGYFVDDQYDGCRNCVFKDKPGMGCKKAKILRKVMPICPFWQDKESVKEEIRCEEQ